MNTLIDSDKESSRRSKKKAVVGIDIGGTQIKMAAFSATGKMVNQRVRETNDRLGTGVPEFAEIVRKLLMELNEPEIAFGIASPGLPSGNGRSIAHQPAKLNGQPLDQYWISHTALVNGGNLEVGLGPTASRWGSLLALIKMGVLILTFLFLTGLP
jgi:hypothetical protein